MVIEKIIFNVYYYMSSFSAVATLKTLYELRFLPVLIGLDFLYVYFYADKAYDDMIDDIQGEKYDPRLEYVFPTYLILGLVLYFFGFYPFLTGNSMSGFDFKNTNIYWLVIPLLGFCIQLYHGMKNMDTFKRYDYKVLLTDSAWTTTLFLLTFTIYWITNPSVFRRSFLSKAGLSI